MHTWIKICGTTCVEDALSAIEAGADALGFIFAQSKRRVTPEQAQAIIRELPEDVERIGVFMDESAETIMATVKQAKLTAVQLHGDESPHLAFALHDKTGVIQTILVRPGFAERMDGFLGRREAPDNILLDAGAGSGKTFDWEAARAAIGQRSRSFIVAGGLTPDNVGEAIRAFHPWGVDVVTGVEREPGRKDPEKLKAFVTAVRRAEQI